MTTQPSVRNTYAVDVLRGVAILFVIIHHAFGEVWGWWVPWSGWLRDFAAAPNAALKWFYPITCGWIGVPLFFVLSGFCIHYSFLRSGRFRAGEFFWRRLWRIYPAYIAALILFSLTTQYGIGNNANRHQFVTHALFVHNGSQNQFFGINGSFWSIAVEVQLYLLFPLLLWLRGKIGIAKTTAALFVVGCLWRIGVLALLPLPEHVINPAWTCPLMCWFDWALGALVAEHFIAGQRTFRHPIVLASLFTSLFAVSTFVLPLTIFSFTFASAAAAVLLDAALHAQWQPRASTRVLAFIGTISYSLYLWHQPLITPITSWITQFTSSPVVAWLALLPALIIVASLSYILLERPGIGTGRKLWAMIGKAQQKSANVLLTRQQGGARQALHAEDTSPRSDQAAA